MNEHFVTSTVSIGYSLVARRIQNLIIIVFKTINNYPPEYLRDLFRLRDNIKNLVLYDSLWQELSKVLGGYYLEQDF